MTILPIIQVYELLQLYQSENLVLIDASNGKNAKSNYDAKHLEGALFVNLNTQLADIAADFAFGGRHPLPRIEDFATTLSQLGISQKSHVVVYDDKNSSNAAARFWWMLKAIGHEKVQVLNGGIQEAEKHNFQMRSKKETITKSSLYEFDHWKLKTATIDEVESASKTQNQIIIDVRDANRFNGETEPIDLIAGHIPGAINIPFTENIDENGLFLSPKVLKTKYEKLFKKNDTDHIIVHCGSGVTACHTLLAVAYAGFEIPKLYVGSWSEWSRNKKPIETNI